MIGFVRRELFFPMLLALVSVGFAYVMMFLALENRGHLAGSPSSVMSDVLAITAWMILALMVVQYIFSFRLSPGNYIVNGVVKKSPGKWFWIKPGTEVQKLPEYIGVVASGKIEITRGNEYFVACTYTVLYSYAAQLLVTLDYANGATIDLEAFSRKAGEDLKREVESLLQASVPYTSIPFLLGATFGEAMTKFQGSADIRPR